MGRTKKSRLTRRRQTPKKKKKSILPLLILVIIGSLFIIFFSQKSFFDRKTNLSIAVARQDGNVDLVVVNPVEETLTTITIPADTQVTAANQLGVWRIKSIWKLGEQEKLSGELLAKTLTRSFGFPTEAWADESFAKSLLRTKNTNLSLKDKIKLTVFFNSTKASSKTNVDLVKAGALRPEKLTDGEEGYVLSGKIPASVFAIFGETNISKEGMIVTVEDATNAPGVARKVGEIVEVLGAKVVSISQGQSDIAGCKVIGPESATVEKIAKVFSCRREKDSGGEAGVKIILGKDFAKSF